MTRQNPMKERGPEPANGRGNADNVYTKPQRDCTGCESSREKTKTNGEKNNVRKN